MTDIIKNFYNSCNPLKAALPSQFVDSDEARGSCDITIQFHNNLKKTDKDFLCFLFTGHLGCGKSSELKHLTAKLKNPDPGISTESYYPVYLNADDFIESYDAHPTDILLAILSAAASEFKETEIILKDNFLLKRLKELKNFLFREIKIKDEAEVSLSVVTAKFNLLKSDPINRELVRKALENDISSLKENIKQQFENARAELVKKKAPNGSKYRDFVLIIDNLEKINRVKNCKPGYESHRQLFIESASQLTGLGAHVVYTVPLQLVIRDGSELEIRYGSDPFVLPMIKIENRPPGRKRYEKGWKAMRNIVKHRIAPNTPLESVIDNDALEFLIQYSGGHTRKFIHFLRNAASEMNVAPINMKAAGRAISSSASLFSRIPHRFWKKLAKLEISKNQSIDSADEDFEKMIKQLIILEYRNGGEETDLFNPSAPWYSVNPIIRELKSFKYALENEEKISIKKELEE
jgi:hypothetical protein